MFSCPGLLRLSTANGVRVKIDTVNVDTVSDHRLDNLRLLHVLRHAKSSWDDPALDDHDRPLSQRGHRAAAAIAGYVAEQGVRPQLILCSSAVRAVMTMQEVYPSQRAHRTGAADPRCGHGSAGESGWGYRHGEVSIEPGLYGASAGQIIKRLRRIDADVRSAMVVGHDPAVQELVLRLTSDSGPISSTGRFRPVPGSLAQADGGHELERIRRKLPTGTLVTLALGCGWADLSGGTTRLVDHVRPRELEGESRRRRS